MTVFVAGASGATGKLLVDQLLFNPGKTSRIHVGDFMARPLVENALWEHWKGQMPVLYNRA
ncbi:hypothetical protein [Cyclobacterium salsum]|uniref:hypothetical protein n=1 Tax=Cyclobacterium salsum TaxID=2666329 RepID=UPI00192EBC5D|nr:hypothetical protein [Cyclobacterium salsum]